jgi:hypothetical protein
VASSTSKSENPAPAACVGSAMGSKIIVPCFMKKSPIILLFRISFLKMVLDKVETSWLTALPSAKIRVNMAGVTESEVSI